MTDPHSDHPSAPSATGKRFAWLAALGVLLALTGMFQLLGGRDGGIVESTLEDGRAAIVLERDGSGHFLAEGFINGRPASFLLDTGATDVALSEKMARAMGLSFGPRITVMTAAGPAPAWRTRLDTVQVGALRLDNVRATITPGLGGQALLGMSFLQYFDWRQENDRLIIETQTN
jgi:aspartyl protease family protein